MQLSTVFSEEVQLLGMLAIDPELALIGADPATVIGRFVQMVTTGLETPYNPEGMPLLNLQSPFDENLGRAPQLSDYLRYDLEKAKAALFDRGAQLPASSQFTLSNNSLWNLMDTFSDPEYQIGVDRGWPLP